MNANPKTDGPGTGSNPRRGGPVPVDSVRSQLAAASSHPTVQHVLFDLQREFGGFGKDASGFGYKYVTLPKILEQLRPVLIEYECIMTHVSSKLDNTWRLDTTLHHLPSGTEISTSFVCEWSEQKGMSNPQVGGSNETYARRYNIVKLLNCSVDDNDAADVYRAAIRAIDESKDVDTVRKHLAAAKPLLPRKDWNELLEHGKLKVATLEGGDDADPVSE